MNKVVRVPSKPSMEAIERVKARTQSDVAISVMGEAPSIYDLCKADVPVQDLEAAIRQQSIETRKRMAKLSPSERERAGYTTGVVISLRDEPVRVK